MCNFSPVGYPSEPTDEEWALVTPCLTLGRLDGSQRTDDLRVILRAKACHAAQPTVMILDSRTLPPTPEPVARAGLGTGRSVPRG